MVRLGMIIYREVSNVIKFKEDLGTIRFMGEEAMTIFRMIRGIT